MNITFYGATWCPDCRRSKEYLDTHNIPYDYIDLETVPEAADEVVRINHGLQSIPTIVFPDGTVLVEPTNAALENAVTANKDTLSHYV